MDGSMWKSFRVRPQNFPYRRIALLARFVEGGFGLMQSVLEARGEKEVAPVVCRGVDGVLGIAFYLRWYACRGAGTCAG